jgi:hypothetical protein
LNKVGAGTLAVAKAHAVLAMACVFPFSTKEDARSSIFLNKAGAGMLRVANAHAVLAMF